MKHASTGEYVRFTIQCNCGPGDNPLQSEICGHIRGNGNFPCRKCHIGGTQKEKETDQGYAAFFVAGVSQTAKETLNNVKKQVQAACCGVAQPVKDLQSNTEVKDGYTQYWIDDFIS